MKTKYFVSIAVLTLLVMAYGINANGDVKMTDSMIKSFVDYRLIKAGLLVNDNIKVMVANQVITLTGEVPTLDAKARAGSEAHKVEESYTIENDLTVQKSNLTDAEIAANVMKRIDGYMFYTIFDWVTVKVNNGVVTLSGWANLPWTASQIVQVVQKVPGVLSVVNDIQKEFGTDELRHRAARVIYSDLMFEPYAYQLNPPIHIIVNGPNVILEGTVQSNVEKKWADNLVTFGTDAINVTNDLKVVK